jgi:hypothetical protein
MFSRYASTYPLASVLPAAFTFHPSLTCPHPLFLFTYRHKQGQDQEEVYVLKWFARYRCLVRLAGGSLAQAVQTPPSPTASVFHAPTLLLVSPGIEINM